MASSSFLSGYEASRGGMQSLMERGSAFDDKVHRSEREKLYLKFKADDFKLVAWGWDAVAREKFLRKFEGRLNTAQATFLVKNRRVCPETSFRKQEAAEDKELGGRFLTPIVDRQRSRRGLSGDDLEPSAGVTLPRDLYDTSVGLRSRQFATPESRQGGLSSSPIPLAGRVAQATHTFGFPSEGEDDRPQSASRPRTLRPSQSEQDRLRPSPAPSGEEDPYPDDFNFGTGYSEAFVRSEEEKDRAQEAESSDASTNKEVSELSVLFMRMMDTQNQHMQKMQEQHAAELAKISERIDASKGHDSITGITAEDWIVEERIGTSLADALVWYHEKEKRPESIGEQHVRRLVWDSLSDAIPKTMSQNIDELDVATLYRAAVTKNSAPAADQITELKREIFDSKKGDKTMD